MKLWRTFCDVFMFLPVVGLIDDKIICMHGGISPELKTVDDINKIDRFIEPPLSGFLCDLLWSDPC